MRKCARVLLGGKVSWVLFENEVVYKFIDSIYESNPMIDREPIDLKKIKILSPFEGNKIIGLGYNYKGLVGRESNFDEPVIFFKSPESILAHEGTVVCPRFCTKIWIEAELTIIIRKEGKNIPANQADEYILGYSCGNDITSENIYNRDWHLAVSKGQDTFAPIGPYLIQDVDTNDIEICSSINDNITQKSKTSDRILNNQECIALVSKYFTVKPGDAIMTGTPAGARDAIIKPGDTVSVDIESVGKLLNYIV